MNNEQLQNEIENILNYKDYDEIVHANNWVLVEGVKNNDWRSIKTSKVSLSSNAKSW